MGAVMARAGAVAGGAFVAAGYEAAKMATRFQATMTRIQTQAGASAKDVRTLSEAVLRLAPSTQQGPQALAEALYHLKSLGMQNAQAMKALAQASNLAAVGGADLEQTTSAIGAAWRSGVRGAQNFSAAAGTVNAIIGAGNMKMQDFIDALSSGILPAARTFGVSLKSVGSALALMTDEGIPAQMAANRLRMTLSLIGAPSAKAAAELQTIGLSSTQLAQTMRGPGGLVAAIGLLKRHLDASGLSATKQAQLISNAFGGGRSSSAIMTLLNNLEVLRRKQVQINNTTNRYGADVTAQRKTIAAQLGILRSRFETWGIEAGRAILPPLNSVLKWINRTGMPAIDRFLGMLGGHGPGGQRQHTLRIGLRRVVEPMGAAAIGGSSANLGRTIGQALGTAMGWLATHAAIFTGRLVKVLAGLDWVSLGKAVGGNAIGFAIGFISNLGADLFSASFWKRHWWDAIMAALSVFAVGRLGGVIAKVLEHLPVLRWFAPLFRGLERLTRPVADAMGRVARAIGRGFLDGLTRVFPRVGTALGRMLEQIPFRVISIVQQVFDAGRRLYVGLGHGIEAGAEGLGRLAGRLTGGLLRLIIRPFGAAADLITRAWRAAARFLEPLWGRLGRVWGRVAGGMTGAWRGTVAFVRAAWRRAGAFLAAGFGAVVTAWQSMTGTLHDAWSNTIGGIRKIARLAWDYIKLAALQMVDQILAAFSHIPFIGHFFKTAEGSVSKWMRAIQADIDRLNGRTVQIYTKFGALTGAGGKIRNPGGATGGKVHGPGSGTDDKAGLFALSNREWVIRANAASHYGDQAMKAVNDKRAVIHYAAGGPAGHPALAAAGMARGGPVELRARARESPGIARIDAQIARIVSRLAFKWAQQFGGSGAAIVRDAMRWIGKIPYVWGGTRVPGGADCSGFVQTIYGRHGIHAPRTSEAQGAWVRRSPPVPGGLAFYNSPAGGAPPGHVAIIGEGGHVISQGGGMGPQYEGLHGPGPLMWTGIPPRGFRGAFSRLGANPPIHGGVREVARSMAAARGWTGGQWRSIEFVEGREAGWRLNARNQSSGAYGIAQFINGPSEYYRYGGNPRTAVGQVTAFFNYIAQRYGSPGRAAAHERRFGWYQRGTKGAAPGWAWVGEAGPELVRMRGGEQVLDHASSMAALMSGATGGAVRGYQAGTHHHHAGTAHHLSRSARLSVVDRWLKGNLDTSKAIHHAVTETVKAIRELFRAHHRRWRVVDARHTGRRLDRMAQDLHDLRSRIAGARAYRANVQGSLRQYAQLGNVPVTFSGVAGGRLTAGLAGGFAAQLGNIRRFGRLLAQLKRAGLSRDLIRQVADMGVDQGTTYAQAILSSGRGQIRSLNRTQAQIARITRGVATTAAEAAYGLPLGRGFVAGLRHERRHLEREMELLAHHFGRSLAGWLHVHIPRARHHRHRRHHHRLATGGWLTEPVMGTGLASGDLYSLAERGPEHVTPARRGAGAGRTGPLVHVDNLNVTERADVDLIARKLAYIIPGP